MASTTSPNATSPSSPPPSPASCRSATRPFPPSTSPPSSAFPRPSSPPGSLRRWLSRWLLLLAQGRRSKSRACCLRSGTFACKASAVSGNQTREAPCLWTSCLETTEKTGTRKYPHGVHGLQTTVCAADHGVH
eukprot:576041-Rhodomonas_salina.1